MFIGFVIFSLIFLINDTSIFFRINSIVFSFFLTFQTSLHVSDYNMIKNKVITTSAIPAMLDEFNMEIVASIEDKFSKVYMSKDEKGELYIRKFTKKLDKFLDSGNIKISPESKYYYIDNKQNIIYFEVLDSTHKKITTLRLFLKSNSFSILTLSYNNQTTKAKISKGYSIIDIDISNFNISSIALEDLNFKFIPF